jgi:hypothetical protein
MFTVSSCVLSNFGVNCIWPCLLGITTGSGEKRISVTPVKVTRCRKGVHIEYWNYKQYEIFYRIKYVVRKYERKPSGEFLVTSWVNCKVRFQFSAIYKDVFLIFLSLIASFNFNSHYIETLCFQCTVACLIDVADTVGNGWLSERDSNEDVESPKKIEATDWIGFFHNEANAWKRKGKYQYKTTNHSCFLCHQA